jgi:hypothetical protein
MWAHGGETITQTTHMHTHTHSRTPKRELTLKADVAKEEECAEQGGLVYGQLAVNPTWRSLAGGRCRVSVTGLVTAGVVSPAGRSRGLGLVVLPVLVRRA